MFICFQRIKAARLKPNDRTLLMASMGGSVDFARMKQQLRQLRHQPNSVTKEDIFPAMEEKTVSRGEDLSYEAWAAYRNKQKQSSGAGAPPAPPPKVAMGRSPSPRKGGRKKTALIGALGNAVVVMVVEVNTIFCPNVPPSRNGRHRLRRPLPLRPLDRPFPPAPWRIPRRLLTLRNIRLPLP